jgi:hypothetical protein
LIQVNISALNSNPQIVIDIQRRSKCEELVPRLSKIGIRAISRDYSLHISYAGHYLPAIFFGHHGFRKRGIQEAS